MNANRPNDPKGYRWERIQRLFDELRYEIERGMMEREIEEQIAYRFIVPVSQAIANGVVFCEFRSRPMPKYAVNFDDFQPKLRVVK